jgi:hypothetical protein
MFTRRSSDEDWVKYLLNTGLTTVDQYQGMRGGRNLVDITELISQNAARFNNVLWVNRALQQDRFHYIPKREIILGEIEALRQLQPLLLARCLNEQILPLSYCNQILYLGLLRYDPDFPELQEILKSIPIDILVCLVPLGPSDFASLFPQIKSMIQR